MVTIKMGLVDDDPCAGERTCPGTLPTVLGHYLPRHMMSLLFPPRICGSFAWTGAPARVRGPGRPR